MTRMLGFLAGACADAGALARTNAASPIAEAIRTRVKRCVRNMVCSLLLVGHMAVMSGRWCCMISLLESEHLVLVALHVDDGPALRVGLVERLVAAPQEFPGRDPYHAFR